MDLPRITSPNTTCLSSRCGVGVHVMKNCEPLVLGPALACAQSDKERQRRYGLRAAAHHGKKKRLRMLDREGFVLELFTIDGLATGSYSTRGRSVVHRHPMIERVAQKLTISSGEVATLDHESADERHGRHALRSTSRSLLNVAKLRALFDDTMKATVFVP